MELGDDCDVGPRVRSRDRGAHTRAAAADDEHIVRSVHDFGRYTNALALGSLRARGQAPCSLSHVGSQSS